MTETQPSTCGQGLAQNSVLPEALGEYMSAMAGLFEAHREALAPADAGSAPERAAYGSLARGFRESASQLASLALEMASYRDMPMAEHDMPAMQRQANAYEVVLERKARVVAVMQNAS